MGPFKMQGLVNRVVIITGGAGGIYSLGADIVRAFHEAKAKVVIADLNSDAAAKLAQELGENALAHTTDITSDAQLKSLVDATVERFGQLDFIVNCAATYEEDGLDSTREQLLNGFDVNTVSAAMLTKIALPHLISSRGAVVNFGSISGKITQFGRFMYALSKAALTVFTCSPPSGRSIRM